MADTIVHWCGSFGGPLCEADSDEVTRIREYYENVFCEKCAEILDAEEDSGQGQGPEKE